MGGGNIVLSAIVAVQRTLYRIAQMSGVFSGRPTILTGMGHGNLLGYSTSLTLSDIPPDTLSEHGQQPKLGGTLKR